VLCPFCKVENDDSSLRCARCGLSFAAGDDGETMAGGPSAPEAAAVSRPPATASAVLTPPPSAAAQSFGAGFSSPNYGFGSMNLDPGTEFGPRYRIESKLGEGGMGTVYKAFDRDLERVVAIKLLRPEMVADPNALARFKQELLLASKISQKNVLRIHDLGDLNGLKFISMAFVEGEDLRGLLNREGKLPFEKVITITRQLCGALEAAQAEGVVHRDMKPQNVMVDKSGSVYVSDFGLAKSLEAGAIGMTRTNEFLGTPRYMSPEQVEGGAIDHRSDIYSLGLIIYEMVAGEVPFTGDSTLQVMFKRVKEPPKDPRALRPDLPDYLAKIILKCLEKDREKRYQSARELIQDLETQHAPSVSMRLPAFTLEGRNLIFAGVGALVLLLAAGSAWYFRGGAKAPEAGSAAVRTDARFLAVLPFTHAPDATLSYVAGGLADGLSSRLGQLSSLHVTARDAASQVNLGDPASKIGRKLGADWLIRGSVAASGANIRVVVSLENAKTGERTWTHDFDGIPGDPLGLEDQVYQSLLTALEVNPTSDEVLRGTAHPTENLDAYGAYLRGQTALRNQKDAKQVEGAIAFFEQALGQDAKFALAYSGLANANRELYRYRKEAKYADRALSAAQQAVRMDESSAEAHFALAGVFNTTGRTTEAIASIRQALQFAPNSDEGYRRLGNSMYLSGRRDEAEKSFQKAVDINPYYWLNRNALGDFYLQIGDFPKALAAFQKVTELEPDNATGFENIGVVYFLQGKYEECIPAFRKAIAIQPYYGTYSNLGSALFYLKRYPEAVQMFEKAVEVNGNQSVAMGNLADAQRWAGQPDAAKNTYDKAIALGLKELRVNPRDVVTLGSLALYQAKKGDATHGLEFARRARSVDASNPTAAYQEAVVLALAKSYPQALKSLAFALEKGYSLQDAENDPELADLRATAEFKALAQRVRTK